MKRIVASIGVAALGAACVQQSIAQGAGDGSKPWTASVALRGFYDDNINASNTGEVESFGFEISPTLAFALQTDQTTALLGYVYSYKYFDNKPLNNVGHDTQTHIITGSLLHAFNERTTVSITDSFVIGQEPDILRSGAISPNYQPISGQNVRNFGSLTVNHQFTPKFGIEVGYANSLFNYEDDVYDRQYIPGTGNPGYPAGVNPISNSGVLDRMDQTVHLDARWTIQPTTVGLIGYAYNYGHYTADQPIGVIYDPANFANNYFIYSDSRDSRSHVVYAGAEHAFLPGLHGNLRVGARFTDYFNSPENQSETTPYLLASLQYDYSKDSSFQFGLSHDVSATDAFSTSIQDGITTGTAATVIYGSFTHRILPKLSGTLLGSFQNSTFQGGQWDGEKEQYYVFNASLTYQINRHVSTSLSYNYDLLNSSVSNGGFGGPADRGFDRNRVFLGATVAY